MKRLILTFVALACLSHSGQARKSYDRGIKTTVFVPKGSKTGGITFSYLNADASNLDFLVLEDMDFECHTFSISPHFAYAFRDDMAFGMRLTYKRAYANINDLDFSLGDDLSFEIDHWRMQQNSYKAGVFYRTYMSLFGSKVVGFYNDVTITYGYSESKALTHLDEDQTGYYQTSHSLKIGARPGLAVFVTNNIAVDVSMDVAGFSASWTQQKKNQIESGHLNKSSANFTLSLLSVGIGVTTYF